MLYCKLFCQFNSDHHRSNNGSRKLLATTGSSYAFDQCMCDIVAVKIITLHTNTKQKNYRNCKKIITLDSRMEVGFHVGQVFYLSPANARYPTAGLAEQCK